MTPFSDSFHKKRLLLKLLDSGDNSMKKSYQISTLDSGIDLDMKIEYQHTLR